jgi:hypothetical protein
LSVSEPTEGVTHAHILEIIIQRLTGLQRKVQNKLKNKRKRYIEGLSATLGALYKRIEHITPQSPEYANIQERILDIKAKIKSDSDNIEAASRMRISHLYESNSGKNTAVSFFPCKEGKKGGGIKKLINENDENITDPPEMLKMLENGYLQSVGSKFTPTMELQEFLDKYEVDLPILAIGFFVTI